MTHRWQITISAIIFNLNIKTYAMIEYRQLHKGAVRDSWSVESSKPNRFTPGSDYRVQEIITLCDDALKGLYDYVNLQHNIHKMQQHDPNSKNH